MGFALYLQHYRHLEPCNLCIFQRVAMIGGGIFFLAGAVQGPKAGGRWFWSGLALLASIAGAAIAARHVWVQSLPPDQVPACGGTLDFLFNMMPWQEVVKDVLRGDTDCAKINAQWLGLSLPLWTMITFIGLTVYAAVTPIIAKTSERNSI